MFVWIFAAEVVLQAVIVQRGGAVFSTHALTATQWGACLAVALGGLPLRAAAGGRGSESSTSCLSESNAFAPSP